jgi:hypothetical protein
MKGVERLEAESAIRELIARYAILLDVRDMASVAVLFAEDCELVVGGQRHEGREGVKNWLASLQGAPGKHMVSNTLIEFDAPPRATSDFVFFVPAEGGPRAVIGGRYLDTFKTVGGQCLFARREVALQTAGR